MENTVTVITNEQKSTNAQISDLLTIGESVLAYIGRPAHHTEIYAVAKELGFPTDKIENVNPRMWEDWRKKSDGSGKFRFYGKSVFGLTKWDKAHVEGCDISQYIPARKKSEPKQLTKDEIVAKIAELQAQLKTMSDTAK